MNTRKCLKMMKDSPTQRYFLFCNYLYKFLIDIHENSLEEIFKHNNETQSLNP